MPAMAPPVRVLASVGSSSSEELPVVLSVTTTWRRRRWVVVEAAARRRTALALGKVMGAIVGPSVELVWVETERECSRTTTTDGSRETNLNDHHRQDTKGEASFIRVFSASQSPVSVTP